MREVGHNPSYRKERLYIYIYIYLCKREDEKMKCGGGRPYLCTSREASSCASHFDVMALGGGSDGRYQNREGIYVAVS